MVIPALPGITILQLKLRQIPYAIFRPAQDITEGTDVPDAQLVQFICDDCGIDTAAHC